VAAVDNRIKSETKIFFTVTTSAAGRQSMMIR